MVLPSRNKTNETKEYYASIFQRYDTDHNGKIDAKELAALLREDSEVSDKIIRKLISYSDTDNDGKIDVHEFTAMILDKKFKTLFRKYITSYVDYIVPRDNRHRYKPTRGSFGHSVEEIDGGVIPEISFCPPPLCMVFISIIEIFCYILNLYLNKQDPSPTSPISTDSEGPVAQYLIYNPYKRQEYWRFLTYMMVHIGWIHLATNLIVQLFLGVPLELRNQWWRVLTVYSTGVVAGSLVTSIMDPKVYLAGASGGVYAIITAHLANMILNWNDMPYALVQLIVFLIIVITDVSTAFYNRYIVKNAIPVGYASHFGGALAGFLVGIWVLKNVEPTTKEKYLWWAAFIIYIVLMGSAVLLNVYWEEHFLSFHKNNV
ncbi:rhomboid-related protein 2-like isoform X2 [Euwallacea fornicatus]|uniref:rhomboid-related protein 2-like isoform X2 n=1 Tax=Euwallacea fornicatus TaxID=995702 RepID=UPI00338E1D24